MCPSTVGSNCSESVSSPPPFPNPRSQHQSPLLYLSTLCHLWKSPKNLLTVVRAPDCRSVLGVCELARIWAACSSRPSSASSARRGLKPMLSPLAVHDNPPHGVARGTRKPWSSSALLIPAFCKPAIHFLRFWNAAIHPASPPHHAMPCAAAVPVPSCLSCPVPCFAVCCPAPHPFNSNPRVKGV